MESGRGIAAALILATGTALAGYFVAQGFLGARMADRFVTVKGISERDAEANIAIWPLRVVASDNDLSRAHAQIETGIAQIRAFLARHEIDASQAQVSGSQLFVNVRRPEEDNPRIISWLVNHGVSVQFVTEEEHSLEDVYLKLIEGGGQ